MADLPSLADIRDKDDAHPHGVVGWRREYHAMREALDAVLALHKPGTVCANPRHDVEWTTCPDCMAVCSHDIEDWPCETRRVIESVIDIEVAW